MPHTRGTPWSWIVGEVPLDTENASLSKSLLLQVKDIFCPTHSNLVGCNIMQFRQRIKVNNSHQGGDCDFSIFLGSTLRTISLTTWPKHAILLS